MLYKILLIVAIGILVVGNFYLILKGIRQKNKLHIILPILVIISALGILYIILNRI